MSRTRERVAGTPGALWSLQDGHISRGGDIQRRMKFVSAYALPAGSHGLASIRSQLYTFGSADLAATTPVGVTYQRLNPFASSCLFINASQNAANTETVVIDGKTYTFQTVLTNVDGHVLIGASRTATLTNLAHSINLDGGTVGTDYATATTAHTTVTALDHVNGTLTILAKTGGAAGNTITITETLAQGAFNPTTTLAGGAAVLTRILDAKPFQGLLYVIAEFDDGNIFHFYNGTGVKDWRKTVSATASDVALRVAATLNRVTAVSAVAYSNIVTVTARTAGTPFTLTAATTDGGADATQAMARAAVTANVVGVAETLSSALISITGGSNSPGANALTSIVVNAVEILNASIDWSGSNASTASRVVAAINNGTAIHGYSAAIVAGAQLRISAAPGTGATPNGYVMTPVALGDVTYTADAAFAGGVTAVTAVAQVDKLTITGTIENQDTFTPTLNATAYPVTGLSAGMGTSLYIDKKRVWSPANSLWRYCNLADATIWKPGTPGADAGFIDVSQETEGNDNLVVAARYQNLACIISQSFITLYALDPDPTQIALSDTLDNTGTTSAKSVVRYGNNDVFYLDPTGIRSLRARDASNAPFISDVGNSIDAFVQTVLATLTPAQVLDAVAGIEPRDGRLWLAAGGYIFVLSFFPGNKISAWSYYLPTEFSGNTVESLVRANKLMYVRAGDTVYLYGGANNDQYPADAEAPCVVELPFLAAGTPATFKEFTGFDMSCVNDWQVDLLYDPNNNTRSINIGQVTKTTFNELGINFSGTTTVIALKLTCSKAGAASISSIQIHFNKVPD